MGKAKKKSHAKSHRSSGVASDSASSSRHASDVEEAQATTKRAPSDEAAPPSDEDDSASDADDDTTPTAGGDRLCKHAGKNIRGLRTKLKTLGRTFDEAAKKHEKEHGKATTKPKKSSPPPVPFACWVCSACGDSDCQARPTHFTKKHEVGLELASMNWHCFLCKLDISDSTVSPKVLTKLRTLSESAERSIGSSAKKATAASAASARAAAKAAEAAEAAAASAANTSAPSGPSSPSAAVCAKGLRNLGNTCFFNSVMQCMAATMPLYGSLIYPSSHRYSANAISQTQPMQAALFHFLQTMAKPLSAPEPVSKKHAKYSRQDDGHVVTPSSLLSAVQTLNPMFRGNRQHDSHELLRTIINGVCLEKEEEERKKKQAHTYERVKAWTREEVLAFVATWPLPAQTRDIIDQNLRGDEEHVWDGNFLTSIIENWASKQAKKPRVTLHHGITDIEERRVVARQLQRIKDGNLPDQSLATIVTDDASSTDSSSPPPLHPFESLLSSTFIHDIFGGVARNTVECLVCHTVSVTHELLLDISLAIEVPRNVMVRAPVATPKKVASAPPAAPRPVISKGKKGHMTKKERKAHRRQARSSKSHTPATTEDEADDEEDEKEEEDASKEADEKKQPSDAASSDSIAAAPSVDATSPLAPADVEVSAPAVVPVASVAVDDAISDLSQEVEKMAITTSEASEHTNSNSTAQNGTTTNGNTLPLADPSPSSPAPVAAAAISAVAAASSPIPTATSSADSFLQYARQHRLGFDRLQTARVTIQNCLAAYTDPDLLTGSNKYGCKTCSLRAQAAAREAEEAKIQSTNTASDHATRTPTDDNSTTSPSSLADAVAPAAAPIESPAPDAAISSPSIQTTGADSEDTDLKPSHCHEQANDEKGDEPMTTSDEGKSDEGANGDVNGHDGPTASADADQADDSVDADTPPVPDVKPTPPLVWVKQDAIKRCQILVPPTVLTLHLKRFHATGRSIEKSSKGVDFPLCFNLRDFMTPPVDAADVRPFDETKSDERPPDAFYHLYGIVSHGGGMGGGHYVAYCRKQSPQAACEVESARHSAPAHAHSACQADAQELTRNWFYFSDSDVRPITFNEVLNVQAYILLYARA